MYDPARVWRLTGDPPEPRQPISDSAGGSDDRQDPVAQRAVHGRPDHAMVGRFMRKAQGIFSYKGSKTRTPLVTE